MLLRCLLALGAASTLSAQTVTLTATALSQISVQAHVGSQVMTAGQPPGLLPPTLYLLPSLPAGPQGQAQMLFSCAFGSGREPGLGLVAVGNSSPSGSTLVSTTTGLVDLLLQVQASAPVTANLVVERTVTGTAGAAMPLQRVDVGNDGSFEVTELSAPGIGVQGIALGTQPLAIRVQFQAGTVGAEGIDSRLSLRFVAANNLFIAPAVSGCTGSVFFVEPSFESTGVYFGVQTASLHDLSIAVLGLGLQPIIHPFLVPSCVLLPSPDLLVALPEYTIVDLPLPASVRPVTLWAQGVVLEGSGAGVFFGLTTTNGFRIDAY